MIVYGFSYSTNEPWTSTMQKTLATEVQLLRRLLDAVPDFRAIPFWSSFIPSIINQCRPDTATDRPRRTRANPATTITQCVRRACGERCPAARARRVYPRPSGHDGAPSPVAHPRRNVTVVMAYNWTRKISPLRRPVRLCSRISWDAIGNTQLPSS